jgi:DNA-binding protein H-NS
MNTEKNTIDTSYEEIQDRVFKLREKEKDLVTDRLKKMTDEERDADTILKSNKLGMYSKGMQKGLTALDKDFYDEEQEFRDEMTKAERNIRKKNADANDENIDILLGEYMEQQQVDTDGVGAPEEEYDDYQEDN